MVPVVRRCCCLTSGDDSVRKPHLSTTARPAGATCKFDVCLRCSPRFTGVFIGRDSRVSAVCRIRLGALRFRYDSLPAHLTAHESLRVGSLKPCVCKFLQSDSQGGMPVLCEWAGTQKTRQYRPPGAVGGSFAVIGCAICSQRVDSTPGSVKSPSPRRGARLRPGAWRERQPARRACGGFRADCRKALGFG